MVKKKKTGEPPVEVTYTEMKATLVERGPQVSGVRFTEHGRVEYISNKFLKFQDD